MSNPSHLSRRRFLQASAAAAVVRPWSGLRAAEPVAIFPLRAAPAIASIVGGEYPDTAVWAYGGIVPGPEIRVRQGQPLQVAFDNRLDEDTTVHWHGMRLPNAMDGVPELTQPPVPAGGRFTYEFTPPDAGTYWYHPHVRASSQQGRGLYGALIIEEAEPPKVDRELLWVLDDWRLTETAEIAGFGGGMDFSHGGRIGNTVTVNGRRPDDVAVQAGERIRLRLINTANARTFGLRFKDVEMRVIALDGHPVTLHTPVDNRLTLASGQRADLIIDMAAKPGHAAVVSDDHYGDRYAYDLLAFTHQPGPALRDSPLDAAMKLPDNPVKEPDLNDAQAARVTIDGGAMGNMRDAVYKGQSMGVRELWSHGKIWTLNGIAADRPDMSPIVTLPQGRSCRMTIRNDTGWPHPMHLHGLAFRVLSRGGVPEPYRPWTDTVLLAPNKTAEIAFVADNPGDWLFHCHILEHHAAGMSSVVRVS